MKSRFAQNIIGMALLAESMMESPALPASRERNPHKSGVLTKKQVKARKKAKAGRKARKRGK